MKITSLDTGIEEILWEGRLPEERLPESSSLIPSENAPERLLDEILYARSLDEHILKSLTPQLSHREITIPGRFQEIVEGVHKDLRRASENTGSSREKAVFHDAARLLEEHMELTSIFNAYRKLLMQG